MKEKSIEKINKMGKVGVVITTIMKVFIIIGIIGVIIGGVACAVLPNDLLTMDFGGDATVTIDLASVEKNSSVNIDEGDLRKKLIDSGELSLDGKTYATGDVILEGKKLIVSADAENPRSVTLKDLTGVCVSGLIALAAFLVTLIFAQKLCKAFRDCNSPFDENVIKKMQNLAYAMIPWVVVNSVAATVANYSLGRVDSINIDLNGSTIITVLVVFALVYVFKYGAMLQQEADETL